MRFLLLGPFAGAWYGSQRRNARTDKPPVSQLHAAARSFLLPWMVFALTVPLPTIVLIDLLLNAGIDAAEIIMWSPVIYIMGIIPFVVLPPLGIAGVVMYVTRSKTVAQPQG